MEEPKAFLLQPCYRKGEDFSTIGTYPVRVGGATAEHITNIGEDVIYMVTGEIRDLNN